MPLGSALNSLLLLAKNLDTNTSTVMPVKKKDVDKPVVFDHSKRIKSLKRGKPEEYGYSQEYLDSYFNELVSDHSIRVNRIMVIKGNEVIAERYEYPYVRDSWDCIFSCTKTVVALALGLLYDDGKVNLDEPVCKILKNEKQIFNNRNKKITLRHLLTMSTGITFNEMETASSYKWVKSFFDSSYKFKLGSKFEYNSLNTYIISVCVEKLAGMKFEELVKERIFKPLDINDTHFDVSPEGYFKGGWGLYILPEDMAKLGILVRDNGMYNDKQIISKEWIQMMSHKQFASTNFGHIYDYGYQMWVDDKIDFCAFNGMYDQDILIFRKSGVIIVSCFADSEAFHGSSLFTTSTKYFSKSGMGNFELCNFHGHRNLKNEKDLMYYYDLIANKEYKPASKIANSCGILPLLLQNELGTYTKGIKGVTFKKNDDNSYVFVVNENHKQYELEFNFSNGVRKVYDFYGNLFDCVCDARFILSGKSDPYLIIRLFFLEFSSSRYFSIKFSKDMDIISLEESENPGLDFVLSLIEIQDESTKLFLTRLTKTVGPDYVTGKIKNIFSPSFPLIHGEAKMKKYLNIKEKKTPKKEQKK